MFDYYACVDDPLFIGITFQLVIEPLHSNEIFLYSNKLFMSFSH